MNLQKLFERTINDSLEENFAVGTVDEVHCSDSPAGHGEYGACSNETREIFVQIGLSATEKRKTLLHEMCHAVVRDECHDEPWQKQMLRIAELGARGMASEAQSYAARLSKGQA